jgi:phosphoserine phosphatase RsbU/P
MAETVLVVDDTPVNQKLLATILRRSGYGVEVAADGLQALAAVAAAPPDLILLDVMMPGKDGFAVCAELKASVATADIPIIFLSAMGEVADKVKGLELGAADYIAKPFDSAEVLARANTQIRLRRLTQSLRKANEDLLAKQKLLEEDLQAASAVQRALIPRQSPQVANLAIAWVFEPCSSIGGDIFNVIPLDRTHAGIYTLDVAGHGVPPAMVSVLASQSLTPNAGIVVRPPEGAAPLLIATPAEVLRALDREYPLDRFERFFTIAYMVLDVESGQLTYSSAGHPPPVLLTADGCLRLLEEGGGIIGVGDPEVEMGEVHLKKGDRVFLYTDGIPEFEDPEGDLFGEERLRGLLRTTAGLDLDAACERVRQSLHDFGRGAQPRDDVSLLAIEYLGNG